LTSPSSDRLFLGDVVLTTPLLEVLAARHGPVDVVTTPRRHRCSRPTPRSGGDARYDKKGRDRGVAELSGWPGRGGAEQYECAYLPHRSLRTRWRHGSAAFRSGWVSTTAGVALYRVRPRATQGHEIDRVLAAAGVCSTMPARTARHAGRSRGDGGVLPARARHPATDSSRSRRVIDLGSNAGRITASWRSDWAEKAGSWSSAADDAGLASEIRPRWWRGGVVRRPVGAADWTLRQSVGGDPAGGRAGDETTAPHSTRAGVDTPTVAIFGRPRRASVPAAGAAGPRGPAGRLVVPPVSAQRAAQLPVGHHLCMKSLSVQNVLQAIEEPCATVVGIDLGGTNIVRGDGGGGRLGAAGAGVEPTSPNGRWTRVPRADREAGARVPGGPAARRSRRGHRVARPLNTKTVLCCSPPQPGWTNYPLRDGCGGTESARHARQRRQLRDFREWWRGARAARTYVGRLTIGTASGAGSCSGKDLSRSSDVAGRSGHMSIDSNGRRCNVRQ